MEILDHPFRLHDAGGKGITFQISDVDELSAVKYYGFVSSEGAWIIMREDTGVDPKTYRYAAGKASDSLYTTAWGIRDVSLAFDYWYNLF